MGSPTEQYACETSSSSTQCALRHGMSRVSNPGSKARRMSESKSSSPTMWNASLSPNPIYIHHIEAAFDRDIYIFVPKRV